MSPHRLRFFLSSDVNRSTGLLRAYTALLRRVSGASSISLYAPPPGEGNPIFFLEGESPLPEHASLEQARAFAAGHESEAAASEAGQLVARRFDSAGAEGWLLAVPCAPYGRTSPQPDRRRTRSRDPLPGADPLAFCWIGLRFEDGKAGRATSAEAFRLLSGADPGAGRDPVGSLPTLGGVLAWYAWQISSILDDPVTGLAGRAEFQASLSQALEESRATGRPLSLLFVNPDDFTAVNERFGHEAGDRVLREIGHRMRVAHRSSDSIAKYGGAIFASFLADADLDAARVVAEKIWGSLAHQPYLDGTLRLGISVGFAVFQPEEAGIEGHLELIRRADKALNAAKRYGGDHVVAWEPELESRELGNLDRMTGVYTGNMAKDYRNMTLLSDTMTVVAASADIDGLVRQVVERLATTLKPDQVGVFEWGEEGEPVLLEGCSRRGTPSGGSEIAGGFTPGRRQLSLLEEVRREGKAILVSFADDFSDKNILSFAVPLLLNDHCLGCLYIDGREDTVALDGSSDLGFLRAFATQLAVALDRARLSEQQQRQQQREQLRLSAEVADLRMTLRQTKLVHRSREMEAVLETVRRVAPTRATVLVIGESGTGKELVARTIHELSPFGKKALVVVDCGAIPTTLIESELFGHERGAYTGAQERRIGRLLEAEGGTVILDEIGELPLEVQSKLLRFVQERQVVPVGGTRVRQVDTRLIAVTNRELAVEAAAGRFREDLYYRLNVVRITVPPLRDRPDDVLHLAAHFLDRFGAQYQKGPLQFSEEAQTALVEHHWPGNVRELSNRIMQAVILTEGPFIGVRDLELESLPPEQTVEMDLSVLRRSENGKSGARLPTGEPASERAAGGSDPEEAWSSLRLALRRRVEDVVTAGSLEPLPLGTWLMEDLVLQAYEAAGHVSGRARTLLGVPETTFRRKLQKARSRERSGLLTRQAPWNLVHPLIARLVRTPDASRRDVLQRARLLLLHEVVSLVSDPARGAAVMGVTLPTYRRWSAELSEQAPAIAASGEP